MRRTLLLMAGLAVCAACAGFGFFLRTSSATPHPTSSAIPHATSSSPHDGTLEEAIQELRKMRMEEELYYESKTPQATEISLKKLEDRIREMEAERESASKAGRKTKFSDRMLEENKEHLRIFQERSGERGKALVESLLKADLKQYREEFEKIYDIQHTTMAPEEIEKAWLQDLWYQVDYRKRVRQYPDSDGNNLIEIRGRVVDQDGMPVPGASLTFHIGSAKGFNLNPKRKETLVTTDEKGVYRIEKERGYDCSLERITAAGYRFLPERLTVRFFLPQGRISAEAKMRRIQKGETSPGNFFEFSLWKELGNPEKVVLRGDIYGERGSMEGLGHRGILKVDEYAYAYDLFKDRFDWQAINAARLDLGKQSKIKKVGMDKPFYETELRTTGNAQPDPREYEGKGDFVSQIFRSPDNPHQAILRITAIGGGVVANSSKSFVAPEEGYQPFGEFPLDLKENRVFAHFFLKSRGGQVYSRLTASFGPTNGGPMDNPNYNLRGGFHGIVSPTGSRVLEPWSPIYTSKEAVAFSTRDWKQAGK